MPRPKPNPRSASRRKRRPRYTVFVAHATADRWLARVLCEKIEAAGAATFRDDRDIAGGDDIPETIRRALRRCDEALVLLTPHSAARPWVLIELGAAWMLGPAVRTVVVRYCLPLERIPAPVRGRLAVDLEKFDRYLGEMRERMRTAPAEHRVRLPPANSNRAGVRVRPAGRRDS